MSHRQRVARVLDVLEAQGRPTAVLWTWPSAASDQVSEHYWATYFGGDDASRKRLLTRLQRERRYQVSPEVAWPAGLLGTSLCVESPRRQRRTPGASPLLIPDISPTGRGKAESITG